MTTTLSKHIWELKKTEEEYSLKWSIVSKASTYKKETKACQLCITEKTLIATQGQDRSLNRRGEVMLRCRHRDKYLLANWVTTYTQAEHVQDQPVEERRPFPSQDHILN